MAHQRYGKGRTMTIGATGLWRWAFMPEDLSKYDQVYKEFWNQTILWLTNESEFFPGQDITFKLNKYAYNVFEPVRLNVQTKLVDASRYKPVIEISGPKVAKTEIGLSPDPKDPSLYSAFFTPEAEGEYTAVLKNNIGEPKQDQARFTAYSDTEETRFGGGQSRFDGANRGSDRKRVAEVIRAEPLAG